MCVNFRRQEGRVGGIDANGSAWLVVHFHALPLIVHFLSARLVVHFHVSSPCAYELLREIGRNGICINFQCATLTRLCGCCTHIFPMWLSPIECSRVTIYSKLHVYKSTQLRIIPLSQRTHNTETEDGLNSHLNQNNSSQELENTALKLLQ